MNARLVVVAALALAGGAPVAAAQEWYRVAVNHTPEVIGNGNVVTQQRGISDFRAVSLEGAGDLIVKVGPRASLSVTADSNLLPLLVQRQRGDELTLGARQSYRSRTKPRYVLTVPDLRSLGIAGSGNARVDGVRSERFSLAIGGSGNIVASGRTRHLSLMIGGSGDIDTRALASNAVSVTIGGSGNARVATNGPLSGTIAGSGSVRYVGRPSAIAVSRFGSGSVAPL